MNHLKIIHASQGSIHKYENLKRKLYNCNVNICVNRQCLQKYLIPNYARILVSNTSPAAKFTQHKVYNLRIKGEIKYFHTKKQQLNRHIYHLHISLDNTWRNTWHYIQQTIEEKLKKLIQLKYKNLDKKTKQTNPRTNKNTERNSYILR